MLRYASYYISNYTKLLCDISKEMEKTIKRELKDMTVPINAVSFGQDERINNEYTNYTR